MFRRSHWTKLTIVALAVLLGLTLPGSGAPALAQGDGAGRLAGLRIIVSAVMEAAAKATKTTQAELLKAMADGKTLAEVIKAKGGDVEAVKKDAKAAIESQVKKVVSDGKMKQEAADALLKNLDQTLELAMTQTAGSLRAGLRELRDVLQAVTDAVLKATKLTRAELLKEVAGGKTLAEVVKAKGGDVEAVKKEAKAAIEAAIKKDVTDGRIKQEQADAFLKNLDQSLDRALNSTLPGAGARNAVDPRVRQVEALATGALLRETARQSNILQRDLLRQLRDGKTLAQVAKTNNADPTKIVKAVTDQLTKQVERLVTAKRLTQAQADQLLKGLSERMTSMMNETNPLRGPRAVGRGNLPGAVPTPAATPGK